MSYAFAKDNCSNADFKRFASLFLYMMEDGFEDKVLLIIF